MVQMLEAMNGGGESVKVGTVGTISALMTRELESSTLGLNTASSFQCAQSQANSPIKPNKSENQASSSTMRASMKHRSPEGMRRTSRKDEYQIISSATPKRQKQNVPSEYKDTSSINSKINGKSLYFSGKTRSHKFSPHISILSSENSRLEKTPLREKSTRKGSNIVDIVDFNCGNSAGSLSNRLKKLGMSRMSQSFM